MLVRCHRCSGSAVVTGPFSQAPRVLYPDVLKALCEEAREGGQAGRCEVHVDRCAALRRAIAIAIGGRDD